MADTTPGRSPNCKKTGKYLLCKSARSEVIFKAHRFASKRKLLLVNHWGESATEDEEDSLPFDYSTSAKDDFRPQGAPQKSQHARTLTSAHTNASHFPWRQKLRLLLLINSLIECRFVRSDRERETEIKRRLLRVIHKCTIVNPPRLSIGELACRRVVIDGKNEMMWSVKIRAVKVTLSALI